MKIRECLKKNAVTALEVPPDLAYQDAVVTMTGPDQAVIENYRCISRYTDREIVILTGSGKVTICGKNLEIPCFTPWEMQVKGCISGIFPERR